MDNTISPDEVITEVQDNAPVESNISNSLQGAMWGDAPMPTNVEEKIEDKPAVVEEKKEEIVDTKDWLKREFDVEDVSVIKAEREELKKLKETPQVAEIKFENEFNEKLFKAIQAGKTKEVRQILETQERLEELSAKEVNNDTAEDIIKMGMSLKYKDLSPKEIEYKYNKEFGVPKEPSQRDLETEEEFAERKAAWQEKVSDIQMNKIIEAKLLRPELESSKAKIVLPEIQRTNQEAPKQTQEDLDAFKRLQDAFVQSAETTVNGFNGFTVQVKDKDVDYSVSYAPSQEEKGLVSTKMKEFAESGFNANAILAERWVKEDGSINVNQMAEDLSRIYMSKNAESKFATESANKRMELYLKEKKNINIIESPSTGIPQTKTESERLQENFWGN
jgi:hypothetical protein